MTNDLIRRGALLEKAVWVVEYDESGCGFDMKAVPIEDVLKAPAVDAEKVFEAAGLVKVVRCKDCKHSELYFFADNGTTRTEQYKCIHHRMGVNVLEPDDFCSYGERRADDATD